MKLSVAMLTNNHERFIADSETTIEGIWKEIGELLNTLSSTECANYFASSGYVCT
jgi:hypothetical protein